MHHSFETRLLCESDEIEAQESFSVYDGIKNLDTSKSSTYEYMGWYLDQNHKNEVILGTQLESNITLYGKFEYDKYTLKFNTAGIGDELTETRKIIIMTSIHN